MTWAVVPVKRLDAAKGRLSAVFPMNVRMRLMLAMLRDVLDSLSRASSIEGVAIVTPDEGLESRIRPLAPNVHIVLETGKPCLNGALRQAAGYLEASHRESMLIIPGDVPLITARDIDALLEYSNKKQVLIVPDKTSKGTNGLFLNPPLVLEPRFGPDSLKRHMAEAYRKGVSFDVYPNRHWELDLDMPDDLVSFLEVGHGTKTYHEIMKQGFSLGADNRMLEENILDNPIRH